MITITDLNDVRVQEFIRMKNSDHHSIITDSHKVISKMLSQSIIPEKLFITDEYWNEFRSTLEVLNGTEIFVAKTELIEKIIGHQLHHGVMAKAPKPQDIPLNQLDDRMIVLNGVTSPENVGSIIRSAAAFGVRSVLVDGASCSPWVRRAIRVSMGNIFFCKVHHTANLAQSLQQLKDSGYQILGTANHPNSVDLPQASFHRKLALIIGSEGHGMAPEIYHCCDHTIRIPMHDDVAHLNAASAASICLYQLAQYINR